MHRPEWRNWQTRGIQNPVVATPCGFDSHPRHLADEQFIVYVLGEKGKRGHSTFPTIHEFCRKNYDAEEK